MIKKMLPSVLVILAGVGWYFLEIYWIGLTSRWFYRMFYFESSATRVYILVVSELLTMLFELLQSLAIAGLISFIKPKSWLLYSALAIFPTLLMSLIILARYGVPSGSTDWIAYLVGQFGLLVQIPLLLLLFYVVRMRSKIRVLA